MSEAATASAASPLALAPAAHLLLPLDLPCRADSESSVLSQDSMSGNSSELAASSGAGSCPSSLGLPPRGSSGSGELEHCVSAGGSQEGGPAMVPGGAPKKVDAKSSALKALAGVSAIVSKSRKVDAEALQAIKSQRAKARAEGRVPAPLTTASSVPAPAPGGAGRATPPAPAPLGGGGGDGSIGLSPFATASSQGLVRTPSSSNLTASLGGSRGAPQGSGLNQASSLPISMHSSQQQQRRRSISGHPHSPGSEYDSLVCKMTITELVALKQAVEGQLAKQALALAQLQASTQHSVQTDMLSQQYAALLLQNAQQAQLVQQLSSQQQATHAAAIQQALSAAASAAGITSQSFSPEQLLLASGPGSGGVSSYPSLPLPDMSSPFATAPYPSEAGFGMAAAVPRAPVPLQAQRTFPAGTAQGGIGSKGSGSPRSASAEQQLIGEALHSFVDPERQGPPSRQGSALVNGINWSDRRSLAPTGPGAPGSGGGGSGGSSFSRSRSLPQPQEGLYQDCSASLSQYLGDGSEHPHLPSLLNQLRLAESLSAQQAQQQAKQEGGMPPSAFASAHSGSLQMPGRSQGVA